MSYTFDDFKVLVVEQVELIKQSNDLIVENAINFHEKNCSRPNKECANQFLKAFILYFERELKEQNTTNITKIRSTRLN